jgi:hypothetical protein
MDDLIYIILICFLTIFILIYGGHNNTNIVEYDYKYFSNLHRIRLFEKKLQKFNIDTNYKDNYINIEDHIKTCHLIIPNLIDLFFIKIEPYSFFKINTIWKKLSNQYLMITFNHNKINNLELFLGYENNNTGIFYDLVKDISITGIYDIYNSSNIEINITIFFIKKPYWYNN